MLFYIISFIYFFRIFNIYGYDCRTHLAPLLHSYVKQVNQTENGRNLRIYSEYNFNGYYDFIDNFIKPAVKYWEKRLKPKQRIVGKLKINRYCFSGWEIRQYDNRYEYICNHQCTNKIAGIYVQANIFSTCLFSRFVNDIEEEVHSNGNGVDADLIIFFQPMDASCRRNKLAAGSPIRLSMNNDMPIAGVVKLCLESISDFHSPYIIIHEIAHILGLSYLLYPYFRDKYGNSAILVRGNMREPKNVYFINESNTLFYVPSNSIMIVKPFIIGLHFSEMPILVTPKVKETVRKYFNCSTAEGLILENEFPYYDGLSHFEKRIFPLDLMQSIHVGQLPVTEFLYALLEDTGWWYVNYSYAEPYEYGRNAGCAFLNLNCSDYIQTSGKINPYCDVPNYQLKCDEKRNMYMFCSLSVNFNLSITPEYRYFANNSLVANYKKFFDHCPVYSVYSELDLEYRTGICYLPKPKQTLKYLEYHGADSRCISTPNKFWLDRHNMYSPTYGARCYSTQCYKNNILRIYISSVTIKCPATLFNQTLQFNVTRMSGTIICPDFFNVCKGRTLFDENTTPGLPTATQFTVNNSNINNSDTTKHLSRPSHPDQIITRSNSNNSINTNHPDHFITNSSYHIKTKSPNPIKTNFPDHNKANFSVPIKTNPPDPFKTNPHNPIKTNPSNPTILEHTKIPYIVLPNSSNNTHGVITNYNKSKQLNYITKSLKIPPTADYIELPMKQDYSHAFIPITLIMITISFLFLFFTSLFLLIIYCIDKYIDL